MFLAEPTPTPYDLHLRVLGFPVRIAPWFWLVAVLLGWDLTRSVDVALREAGIASPGQVPLLLFWIAAVLVSILLHELGHALAMRYYGIPCSIVLYHFGGLAIPSAASAYLGSGRRAAREHPYSQIVISAAGPGAQLLVAGVLVLGLQLGGYGLPFAIPFLEYVLPLQGGRPLPSVVTQWCLVFFLWPSVAWALLNLLPVYPLDGGQIVREVLLLISPRDGIRNSLMVSIVAAALVAAYAYQSGDLFLCLMFASLAFSSFQILQAYSGPGGYGRW